MDTTYFEEFVGAGHINKLCVGCYEILPGNYAESATNFPEYYLANVLGRSIYVICTDQNLAKNLDIIEFYKTTYKVLIDDKTHAIYFVGSYTTPIEDNIHCKAISHLNIPNKFGCCIIQDIESSWSLEIINKIETFSDVLIYKEIVNFTSPKYKFYADIFKPYQTLKPINISNFIIIDTKNLQKHIDQKNNIIDSVYEILEKCYT